MSNILQFPARPRKVDVLEVVPVAPRHDGAMKKAWPSVVSGFQLVLALVWPVLRWVLAIDVAWQFFRMLFQWNTPGVHAGWTFVIHFLVFVAITYFVTVAKPRK